MIEKVNIEQTNITRVLLIQGQQERFEVLLLCFIWSISLVIVFYWFLNESLTKYLVSNRSWESLLRTRMKKKLLQKLNLTLTRATKELTFSKMTSLFVFIKFEKADLSAAGYASAETSKSTPSSSEANSGMFLTKVTVSYFRDNFSFRQNSNRRYRLKM